MMPPRSRFLALTLPACILLLLGLEVGLRLALDDPPPDFVVQAQDFDSTYHHPYWFDPATFTSPPEGGFRILFLGDSFTEGVLELTDHAATIPNFTARGLREQFGVEAVAWNAGTSSYAPIIEYLILRNIGLNLRPDLVVMLLDESDVQDDAIYATEAVFDAAGRPERVGASALRYKHVLYRSKVVRMSLYGYLTLRVRPQPGGRMSSTPTALQRYNAAVFDYQPPLRAAMEAWHAGAPTEVSRGGLALSPIFLPVFRMSYNHGGQVAPSVLPYYAETMRFVGMSADLCRAAGIPFVLVTYPYPFAVDPSPYAQALRAKWGYPKSGILSSHFHPYVAAWAAAHGVDYVDLTDAVTADPERIHTYYFNASNHPFSNEHFNERGNALMGAALAEYLATRLPPPVTGPRL